MIKQFINAVAQDEEIRGTLKLTFDLTVGQDDD